MSLLDIWDYIRASGDRRFRQQGYLRGGVGIIERYRRAGKLWEPHLDNNRRALREIAAQMTGNPQSPIPNPRSEGGTLIILGAGRLLDVPWQDLFPLFQRVVLADADSAFVPYVERLLSAAHRATSMPQPIYDIGDVTASVVDLAAWAEHTIAAASSPSSAADALADGCDRVGAAQAPWARTYVDVRLVVSSNLLSQLGYFPRLHIQTAFRRRFGKPLSEYARAAESLEKYFDRVRARHIADVASFKKAWAYVATDVETLVYTLPGDSPHHPVGGTLSPAAGQECPAHQVELDEKGEVRFAGPAKIEERDDPLHGQRVKDLWPRGTKVDPPRRWVWHIVPQGSEKNYRDRGRVHVVEAWTKQPG